MAKAYILRGQGLGFLHGRVFLHPPSRAEIGHVLRAELAHHGWSRVDGAPIRRWVRIEEVELIDNGAEDHESVSVFEHVEGELTNAEIDAMLYREPPGPAGEAESTAGVIAFSGTGTVTP